MEKNIRTEEQSFACKISNSYIFTVNTEKRYVNDILVIHCLTNNVCLKYTLDKPGVSLFTMFFLFRKWYSEVTC